MTTPRPTRPEDDGMNRFTPTILGGPYPAPGHVDLKGSGTVHWMYPDIYEKPHGKDLLKVVLYNVRAASPLLIRFEAERNVWSILVEETTGWEKRSDVGYPITRLREVATVDANDGLYEPDYEQK